jgi:heat shock protein HtpX
MSNLKVFVLMAGLTALFIVIGGAVAGQTGAVIAFVLALGMNLFAYFNSAKMVLKAYRARIVDRSEAPELYGIVERLAQQAGLPMPTLAIAPHEQPNAFATGRNPENAVVCVTEGILKLVDRDELEGVLGHELGHVKNRDMLLQTITASLSGAITNLARFGMYMPRDSRGGRGGRGGAAGPLMILLGPLAAVIMQFAISRSREFKANATGAEISKKPVALASALGKLEAGARRIPMNVTPAVAPLAQVNPLAAFGGGFMKLFSTHPSTQERIRRLEEIAQRMGGLQSRPG